MDAVVSLIDTSNSFQANDFNKWVDEFGITLNNPERFPLHLTWHAADQYNLLSLANVLSHLAVKGDPFKVRTAGFGIFTGKMPVFYITLVKTRFLMEFHEEIWRSVSNYAIKSQVHFAPENWVPHITLNTIEVISKEIIRKLQSVTFREMEYEIVINNIALIYKKEELSGILEKYELSKEIRDDV